MKKLLSIVLAVMLVLTAFPMMYSSATEYPDIIVSPSQLNLNMDANASMVRTITKKDGIDVVKMLPNSESAEDFVVDGYNISSRNVDAYYYRYASVDYYYETENTDSSSNPVLGSKMLINMLRITNPTTTYGVQRVSATQAIVANQWARATFDLSAIADFASQTSGTTFTQYHFYPLGIDTNGNTAGGTLYINNLSFCSYLPGTPTISEVAFATPSANITRGKSVLLPQVTVVGTNNPMQSYDIEMSGHSSASTRIENGKIYVGADETAESFTISATAVLDNTKTGTLTVNVTAPAPRSDFDADNITLRFGVVSDTHVSGSWNQPRSKAKFSHMIDVFQKTAENDGATVDAIIVNGDFVDAINSLGNVSANKSGGAVVSWNDYGSKMVQNYREVNYVAQALWGADEEGYGNGVDDGVRFFYALGNHDEGGKGQTGYTPTTVANAIQPTVYSAEFFAAVFCGWKFDMTDNSDENSSDLSYVDYINDLIDYNTNPSTTINATDFEAEFDVTLASADAKFDKYYGFDLNYSNTNGLLYGNRHMTIGTGDNAIHFIAIELSQSADSQEFARQICEQSVSENPNKPIFIVTHYKMANTMLGSGDSPSTDMLANVIKNYPQVVIWGGHSHTFLHSDGAIDSTRGYTQIDSSVTAYASLEWLTRSVSMGAASDGTKYAANFSQKEDHAFGNGCYVEVDKNFNVRVNRIDLYRSFSADYAENTALYSTGEFTNYSTTASKNTSAPVDAPVFIREPWDITDISASGTNLEDYTTDRKISDKAPYFPTGSEITAEGGIGVINATLNLNAVDDDGMVYMYVLEVFDSDDAFVKRYYYTNYFFDFPNIADMPTREVPIVISGLNAATEYKLSLYAVDDFDKAGEAITTTAETASGKLSIELPEGKIGVFVDTSSTPVSTYTFEGEEYLVHTSFTSAINANADYIFYIKGTADLYTTVNATKKALEIKGLDRDNCVFTYKDSTTLKYSLTLTDVSLNKTTTGDTGLVYKSATLTLNNCKTIGNPLNFFNTGWGNAETSGDLVINCDTELAVNSIYPGPNYSATANSKGDEHITINGGTYNGTIGNAKAAGATEGANKLDGNLFITVNDGVFKGKIQATSASKIANVTKNAVVSILGGDLSAATLGHTGTSNAGFREVYIVKSSILKETPVAKASKTIVISIPDNEGGIGEPSYDTNGSISSFEVLPIENKQSFVNGISATSVTLADATDYVVTYKTANGFDFNINGGTGTAPAPVFGTAGEDYTDFPDMTGFERKNYNFVGWALTPDATEALTTIKFTADGAVLYAVWAPKTQVTFTLNPNGGSCSSATFTGFADDNETLPIASKSGSIFVGWADSADATSGKIVYNMGTSPKTVYAIYKAVSDDVIYIDTTAETNGDGRSPFSPMNSVVEAFKAGNASGTTYVLKNSAVISENATVGNGFANAVGPVTFTATDPATGEVYDAFGIFATNSPYFAKDCVVDCTIAYIGTSGSPYLNVSGKKLEFTSKGVIATKNTPIPGTDKVCAATFGIRGGGDGNALPNGATLVFANLDNINGQINAGTACADVGGDLNVYVNGGKHSRINLGNNDYNAGGKTERTFSGFINLIVNDYTEGAPITLATDFYSNMTGATVVKAMNIVLNNGVKDKISALSYNKPSKLTFAGGLFKVYSGLGGVASPTNESGKFLLVTDKPVIKVNGVAVAKTSDNIYTLSGGANDEYVITYEDEPIAVKHKLYFNIGEAVGTAPAYQEYKKDEVCNANLPDGTVYTVEGKKFAYWADSEGNSVSTGSVLMPDKDTTFYAVFTTVIVDFTTEGSGSEDGEYVSASIVSNTVIGSDKIASLENLVKTATGVSAKNASADVSLEIKVLDNSGDPVLDLLSGRKMVIAASALPTLSSSQKLNLVQIDGSDVNIVPLTVNDDGSAEFIATKNGFYTVVICDAYASYTPKASYDPDTGTFKVDIFFGGDNAAVGFMGFDFDKTVFDFVSIPNKISGFLTSEYANDDPATDGYFTAQWDASAVPGGIVQAETSDVLVLTINLSVKDTATFDTANAKNYFHVHTPTAADTAFADDTAYKDGFYNYTDEGNPDAPLSVAKYPIAVNDIIVTTKAAEQFDVSGTLITVREDGDSPYSENYANIEVKNGSIIVYSGKLENSDTEVGNVPFTVQLPEGAYSYKIEKNGYLTYQGTVNVTESGTNSFGDVTLVAGDIKGSLADRTGDGIIDLSDFIRVIRGFDTVIADEFKKNVDIDESGIVTIEDLVYVKSNFGANI